MYSPVHNHEPSDRHNYFSSKPQPGHRVKSCGIEHKVLSWTGYEVALAWVIEIYLIYSSNLVSSVVNEDFYSQIEEKVLFEETSDIYFFQKLVHVLKQALLREVLKVASGRSKDIVRIVVLEHFCIGYNILSEVLDRFVRSWEKGVKVRGKYLVLSLVNSQDSFVRNCHTPKN